MSGFLSLVWFVTLIAFVVYWRKKKAAKRDFGPDSEEYRKVSTIKRAIGVVCVLAFIGAGATAPKQEDTTASKPAVSTTSSTSSSSSSSSSASEKKAASEEKAKKPEPPKKQLTLQQQALKDTSVSIEYRNALKSGINYATVMHMSKQGVYDQLVSEYGDHFQPEAAQWAVEHMSDIDWNKNAVESAKTYQKEMAMSRAQIQQQLASPYGDKFTEEEAQYAVDHLPQ
ncbi:Ltp family lipoprotein [uncultured Selenomonas sp.]|uniref:Ltp family lipoprotein n=1 Tax=uncultured Selenomonas sp. TaxID=159275 RepID=UPI002600E82B|nr:Ltp family lipoprotein [uncultured Selenomonas sp.]